MDDKETIKNIKEALKKLGEDFQLHNGQVTFVDFKNGILFLEMKGACTGCPSSACGVISNLEYSLKSVVSQIVKIVFI